MDRTAAQRKIHKLEALANDAAATPSEAATARRMASRLRDRYGITHQSTRPPPPRRPHHQPPPAPAGGFSMFGDRAAFIQAFDDAMSDFNPNTGQTKSDRVTVHHWTSRANWRIELDI